MTEQTPSTPTATQTQTPQRQLISKSAPKRRRWVLLVGAGVVIAAVAAGGFAALNGGGSDAGPMTGGTAVAKVGTMTISVTERGNLRAKSSEEIVNEVEGQATILELVPEGSQVKKGDVLVKLDASDLEERLVQEQTGLNSDEADYLAAREAYAIQQSLRESEVTKAQLNVKFAEIDLEKFIEGDREQQLEQAKADITVAQEELEQAKDRVQGTERLYEMEIVSEQELKADKLAVTKTELNLDRAKRSMELLQKYEHPKQLTMLESDLHEAKAELERVKRQQDSSVAQKKASLDARKTNYELQRKKVDKLREQIDKATILAPQNGMIVYWTPRHRWSNQRPPEVGGQVRYGQTLMTLPDVSRMEVDVKVHESQVDRITEGLPCAITVDAFPDRTYTGKVESIAVMADSQRWFNPDVKVYNTIISIDQETEGLKPGMSAEATILAATVADALLVPVTGVHVLRGRTAAIVRTPGGFEVRRAEIARTNDRMVEVTDGLEPGDEVLLYKPESMPDIPWEAPKEDDNENVMIARPDDEPDSDEAEGPAALPKELSQLTDEQKEALRKRFENMTDAERKQAIETMQQKLDQQGEKDREPTTPDGDGDSDSPAEVSVGGDEADSTSGGGGA